MNRPYGGITAPCSSAKGDPAEGEKAAGDAQGVQGNAGHPQDTVNAGPDLQLPAAPGQDIAGEDQAGRVGVGKIVINDVGCHRGTSVRSVFFL